MADAAINLAEKLAQFSEHWARQYLDQAWAEIYEGPCELPTAYPDNQFGYRVCIKMPAYPQGTWIDVLLDANDRIVGAHHVPSDVVDSDDVPEA